MRYLKWLLFALSLLLMLALLAACSGREDMTWEEGDMYFLKEGSGCTLVKYAGDAEELVIPAALSSLSASTYTVTFRAVPVST